MKEDKTPRMDKFLWSVRLFKTRTLAMEACKKGRVLINDIPAKPSRVVKIGEKIEINNPPVLYSYQITGLPKSRVSAKLVAGYLEDLTSPEELNKLKNKDVFFVKRDRGTGRPTKKERRLIDKVQDY